MATVLTPAEIKQKITDWITTNGNHEITGAHLNTILAAIMDYVGVGYAFMGEAPSSAPSPDVPSAYIAGPGTYTNYESGDTVIPEGSIAVLKYDGSAWSKSVIKVCDPVSVSQNASAGGFDLTVGGQTINIASQNDVQGIKQLIRNPHPVNLLPYTDWKDGYYDENGDWHQTYSYKTAEFEIYGSESFEFYDNCRFICAWTGDSVNDYQEYGFSYKTSQTTTKLAITFLASRIPNDLTQFVRYGFYDVLNGFDIIHSFNLLDANELTDGFLRTNGGRGYDSNYCFTGFIKVEQGKKLIAGAIDNVFCPSPFGISYVTAYDENLDVLSDKGAEDSSGYIVPNGVAYVRVSLLKSRMGEKTRINLVEQAEGLRAYDSYFERIDVKTEQNVYEEKYNQKYRLFTNNLSLLNNAKIQRVGTLTKPYICLMSDDGNEGVATYSIPMCIAKGIPMTFAIMKGSGVLASDYLSTLKDSIQNHGCTVAQHGWFRWDDKSEDILMEFCDNEKAYWDSIGLEMKGAVCPADYMSDLCAAAVGSRFGILRAGYYGLPSTSPEYPYAQNGARSNMHALSCIGLAQTYDSYSMIDDAIANNRVLIAFYHEVELDATIKAGIEAWIDYALAHNVEFITLDKLDTIL